MGFISLAPLLSFHSHTPGYVISEWKHPKKKTTSLMSPHTSHYPDPISLWDQVATATGWQSSRYTRVGLPAFVLGL